MDIDVELVRRLIDSQFPQWKGLSLQSVPRGGWDNRIFRLGDRMLVRLPSSEAYAGQVEKEQKWLQVLSGKLPLRIPNPIAMGKPGSGYPWHWSIYEWVDGEAAGTAQITDMNLFAKDLSFFLKSLHKIDPTGGPKPGPHSFYRGGSLKVYDDETRAAIDAMKGQIDPAAALQIWETALRSSWQKAPVWVHGDISPGNLLVKNGKLTAVIDFGQMTVGDPACDLSIAWTFFSNDSREIFRSELNLDSDTWARALGWTLWKALIIVAKFTASNSFEGERCHQILEEIFLWQK